MGYDQKGIQNRLGSLFFCEMNFITYGITSAILTFNVNIEIVIKDLEGGLYGIVPFMISDF